MAAEAQIAPPAAIAKEGPNAEATENQQESQGFLAKKAEQAKAVAQRLRSAFQKNAKDPEAELQALAAGDFDKAAATQEPAKIDQVTHTFVEQLNKTDDIVGTIQDEAKSEDATESTGFFSRMNQKLEKRWETRRQERFDTGEQTQQKSGEATQASHQSETPDTITATSAAGEKTTSTSEAVNPQSELADKHAQFDAIYDSFKNGTINKAEYAAQIQKLQEPLPQTEAQAPEPIATTSQHDTASEKDIPHNIPEHAKADAATTAETNQPPTTKESLIALGVDPDSQEGKMLFDLIDADPESGKAIMEKVTQAKELQTKMIALFQEAGITLDGKKAFNFALGEITEKFKLDLDALAGKGEANPTVLRDNKILAILKALLMALGIGIYAVGTSIASGGSAIKTAVNSEK
ncbi:MAG TPA: hypothetical protein VNW29_01195 [Candidatus Sulfotelmatobacter sp.]|nr:hypothetical protein [Candidatus Sulfotelmatobacter sp.]